ncbi:MAG: RQC domain protein [Chloroflexi bacterium]|nr:RQC domain protein [Chloroflexota bacterium]
MSRKRDQVPIHLDSKGIQALSFDEIKAILRAADELIFRGGRTLLVEILKGSHSSEITTLRLDLNPMYSYYAEETLESIKARVDWMILNGYLALEYDGRLPLLVYTKKGWNIEKSTYAQELVAAMETLLNTQQRPYGLSFLKDRNRELIWGVLDIIKRKGESRFIPLLEDWAAIDYHKVGARIREVITVLQSGSPAP